MRTVITQRTRFSPKLTRPLRFAVAADLHNGDFSWIGNALDGVDATLIPGDLVNRHKQGTDQALAFLRLALKQGPVFFSPGNHEWRSPEGPALMEEARRLGVTVLDNACTEFKGIRIGSVSAAPAVRRTGRAAAELAGEPGFRLLLCHHPEHYRDLARELKLDLTVAGHAHGGQVELFGRGVYAPGQGLFPRYTAGWYDEGRLLVSRGMTNHTWAPRLWNPCELILLTLEPGEEGWR